MKKEDSVKADKEPLICPITKQEISGRDYCESFAQGFKNGEAGCKYIKTCNPLKKSELTKDGYEVCLLW
jgi:hypothetical protein